MARIEGAITIVCPVETVFDYFADQTHEPRYNPIMSRVEKLTTGEIGPGIRFRSVARSAGRTAEMVTEYTDVDRPRLLASVTTMKLGGRQERRIWTGLKRHLEGAPAGEA